MDTAHASWYNNFIRDRGGCRGVKTVLVLASGGIDSTACIHYYMLNGYFVETLHVDYGHAAFEQERHSLMLICDHYGLPYRFTKIDGIQWSVHQGDELIGRNLLLAAIGLSAFTARHGLIALGLHDGSNYADCSREFQELLRQLSQLSSRFMIDFDFPFGNWTKSQIVGFCNEHKTPLSLTYSCTQGTAMACGSCSSCLERNDLLEYWGTSHGST